MMGTPQFEVFISGATSSVDDWKRAMSAPESELPELDAQQKEVARRMDIPEKEYARGVLVQKYGELRQRERGQRLGARVDEILDGLGAQYKLDAVIREGTKFRWVVRILTPQEPRNIAVPLDLADDVIDSATIQDLEKLRRAILEGLGRKDLLGNVQ